MAVMAPAARATILIVENGDTLAPLVARHLPADIDLERVHQGVTALRHALASPVALAIVDADLGAQPDGPETIYWLRRLFGVRVIAVSAHGDAEMRLRIAAAAPDAFLVRPVGQIELQSLVSSIVERHFEKRSRPFFGGDFHDHGVPAVVPHLPSGFRQLTGREWQVILDFVDTPNAQAVAAKRGRSAHTVHNQLKSIFRKLGVHSLPELLSLLLRISRSPQ